MTRRPGGSGTIAGPPVFVEAYITDSGDVHLEWFARDDTHPGRWTTLAAAAGETVLDVGGPRPFRVVPNRLLRPDRLLRPGGAPAPG